MNYKNKKFKYNRRHAFMTQSSINQSEISQNLKPIDEYNENAIEIISPKAVCCTRCLKFISDSVNILKAIIMR
jgi:hypothetical protein